MDFRAEDGLLNKIYTLVAPPQSAQVQKNRGGRKTRPVSGLLGVVSGPPVLKHPAIQNHPYCDACGDGGNLLCCDKCPSSFHFFCCDPPVDPKQLPSGDWLCRRCRAGSVGEGVPPLFRPLIEKATGVNPLIFDIPLSLQSRDIIPGGSRKDLTVKQKRNAMLLLEDKRRYCFACNKSSRFGHMVSCDFCPLMFHLDCLEPPLTALPTTAWICPVHPNKKIPGFDHPRLTERLRAMEESRADVVQHTVKLDFIDKVRKIPAYKRITQHHNRRVSEVPPPIKALYSSPLSDVSHVAPLSLSLVTPRESMERQRLEEERERKLFTQPRLPLLTKDQDDWTRWAVLCQVNEQASSIPNSLSSPEPTSHELSHSENSDLSASKSDSSISICPFNDSSVSSDIFAASVLLELAGNKAMNGPRIISKSGPSSLHSLPNGFVVSNNNQYPSTPTKRYSDSSFVDDHRTDFLSSLQSSGQLGKSHNSAVMNGEANHTQDTVSTQNLASNSPNVTNVSKLGNVDSEDLSTNSRNLFNSSPTGQSQHSECKTMDTDIEFYQVNANTASPSVSLVDGVVSCGQSEPVSNSIGHDYISPCPHIEESKGETNRLFEEVNDEERDSELEVVDDGTDDDVITCSPVRIEVSSEESDMELEMRDLMTSFSAGFVPDLSHLDGRMVRLLATQRLQQLFSGQLTNTDIRDTSEISPPHSPHNHLKDLCKEKFLGSKRLNGLQVPAPESSTSRNSPSHIISRATLTTASALLCPISGNGYPFAIENRVTYLGTGSGVDVDLFKCGHCNYITEKHACVFLDKETGDFELINYSEFGSMVDGILYSCDFSDKQSLSGSESAQESSPVPLVLDDIIALGHGRRARQAKGRLELARKSLSDKRKAKEALEGALKLAVPVSAQDDALLAEELSKSEGLMTRTGLKRVSADTSTVNPSVVSIPLAKARKMDGDCSSQTKAGNHEVKPVIAENLMSLMSKSIPTLADGQPVHSSQNSLTADQSSKTPCMCGSDPSSSNENNGRRLEGTGVLSHGSQLKFGCLQFLFSMAGCPGHEELISCLLDGDDPTHTTQLS